MKRLYSFLIILLATSLNANEQEPAGSRPLPIEYHALVAEERSDLAQLSYEEKQLAEGEKVTEAERVTHKAYWHSSHGGANHKLAGFNPINDINIQLDDLSTWYVHPKDRNIAAKWKITAPVTIIPNRTWLFSSHCLLKIVNKDTDESVRVNLKYGPVYQFAILEIDNANGEVTLSDRSIWEISRFDRSNMKDWQVGDVIVIGINDAWYSLKPNILINVNSYNYVSGSCHH